MSEAQIPARQELKIESRHLFPVLDSTSNVYQSTGTLEQFASMEIKIDPADGVPIYRQIVNQIRYSVASGLLQPGDELPTIRAFALRLKVTPNTIVKAYEELESAGIVQMRHGSGTFVSAARTRLADWERRRIIEQRIDALLTEAHQLDFSVEQLFKLMRRRQALMSDGNAQNKAGDVSGT
jgi:GntR family transcriptional regulator